MSGPPALDPMSGPGYGAPYSAAPYSGAPDYGPPPAKRSIAMPLFAALTELFSLVSAVITGLIITKSGAYVRKGNDGAAKTATIAPKGSPIGHLHKQVP